MPTRLPPSDPDPGSPSRSDEPEPGSALRGIQGGILLLTLGVIFAMALLPLFRPPTQPPPKRIRIVGPLVDAAGGLPDGRVGLWAIAARDVLERQLASREGLWGLTTAEAAADEELVLELDCRSAPCLGNLRRIRTVDGVATWHRPGFRLPAGDLLGFAEKLGEEVELAFLRHPQRADAPRLYVEEGAYRRFLRHRRALDTPPDSVGPDPAVDSAIDELESLLRAYPRFADAYLLAARAHLVRRGPEDRQRALELLGEARRIAGGDGRTLERLVPLALELGRTELAAEALDQLATILPGDPRLVPWRHRLVEIGPARARAASGGPSGTDNGSATP